MNLQFIQKRSTLLLRIAVSLLGVVVLVLCALIVKVLLTESIGGYYPILIGMIIASIPFFIGIHQTLKLLNLIDRKKAFSQSSIEALNKIKYCAGVISVIYGLGMPYIFIVAERDDAPGVVLLGLIFTFAPMAIAIFSRLFQKVLKDAIDLKSENDLTV